MAAAAAAALPAKISVIMKRDRDACSEDIESRCTALVGTTTLAVAVLDISGGIVVIGRVNVRNFFVVYVLWIFDFILKQNSFALLFFPTDCQ